MEAEQRALVKVVGIETVDLSALYPPPFILVLVHTDEGLVGLGQTADPRTVPAVHKLAAEFLIGRDPLGIEAFWNDAFHRAGRHGYAGAELRAVSALDIALWDLLGQVAGLPIHTLLGGACHASVPVYNTCSPLGNPSDRERVYEDPVGLAGELLAGGINCMKWSVFDLYARESRGQRITAAQIEEATAPIVAITDAFGGRMEVMVEGHGLWNLTSAIEIARGLEGLPVRWLEDMIWQDNPEACAELRRRSSIPIAGSERLFTRHQVRRLLELQAVDVLIGDVTWTGGITELRKVAAMADAYGVPLAPHDHSGPVNLWASAHVLLHVPNAYMMETTRAFYDPERGYYHELVEGEPLIGGGSLQPPKGPGLGIKLLDGVPELPEAEVVRSGMVREGGRC